MKPKDYLKLIQDDRGFVPLPIFRSFLRKNPRKTAREEAIAAEVIRQANPRQNISGHHPWGPEESWVTRQLWTNGEDIEWRDIPKQDKHLYEVEETRVGPLPVPNAVKHPETVPMDLQAKIRELLGE